MRFLYLLFMFAFIGCGKNPNEVAVPSDFKNPEQQRALSDNQNSQFEIDFEIKSNEQPLNVLGKNDSNIFIGKYLFRAMKNNFVIDPALKLKLLRSGRIFNDQNYNNKI